MLYMVLNMIFLPLTGLVTLDEFIILFFSNDLDFIEVISRNMGSMAAFFGTYLLQVTFISNCIMLLDIPHFLYRTLKGTLKSFFIDSFEDDWFFDLGYY